MWLQLPTAALSATPACLILHPSGSVDEVACERVAWQGSRMGWLWHSQCSAVCLCGVQAPVKRPQGLWKVQHYSEIGALLCL